ncbi:putative polyvalent protein kinase domain-containing protein [Puia dinghuensis]|uniref:Uncharacterized protein n=1 Tax=Puia dinghuensis TaxID=1792502 RepID=A0A8J2UD15_9BACT|nr:hypothetical protein [Puia dinghuensis]GGB01048.1 hypothetical protein GCM10011511_25470 [Puia dinghuensis]
MISDEIRQKLQNIVRGELHQGQSDPCTAIRNLLCESFGASPTVKSEFESRTLIKEKQVGFLKAHAQKSGLWLESLPQGSQYLTEGGESKVYLSEDGRFVIKVNDAAYYATWTEYFNSLLLHNLLFSNSAYSLLGNAFAKTRRQDYYNSEFGLTLEDMHDENVIAKDNILFFIDTVFYIM